MTFDCLDYRAEDGIAEITLNRPPVNALNMDLVRELIAALRCVAETTVIPEGDEVLAYIRPQKPNWDPVVLVSVSKDFGRTWSEIRESNFSAHMTKVYAGKLSTGQRYLIANQGNNRHSLVIAVSRPDQKTFSKIWKIRHGLSAQPRFPGQSGKGPQWCYPYAIEHDDSLYAVYSVTKEDCELSIIPLEALS